MICCACIGKPFRIVKTTVSRQTSINKSRGIFERALQCVFTLQPGTTAEFRLMEVKSVLWFRHGLRLHDNPALLEAIRSYNEQEVTFYPVFIFDGESAGEMDF